MKIVYIHIRRDTTHITYKKIGLISKNGSPIDLNSKISIVTQITTETKIPTAHTFINKLSKNTMQQRLT